MKKTLTSWYQYLIKFLYLQLFITLISLPIIVAWGLPLSLLSILGNLIFSPILALFLFLSSLIFMATLLHIPCQLLIIPLEYLTSFWLWCMRWADPACLIGIVRPPWYVLALIFIATVGILHSKRISTPERGAIALTVLCIMIGIYARWATPSLLITAIVCNKGEVTLIKHHHHIVVIDPGYIGSRISAASWLDYTLMPAIIKTTGKTHIDHLIMLNINQTVFESLSSFLTKTRVGYLYLPWWEGKLPYKQWKWYLELKEAAQKNNCIIRRIREKPIKLYLGTKNKLVITPSTTLIYKDTYSYPQCTVSGTIDLQPLTLVAKKTQAKQSTPLAHNIST